jgi:sugar phosphate isomerase/epimerase
VSSTTEPRSSSSADRIGIERLCVFALPPVEFVELAADLDCRHIGIGLTPMAFNPHDYPSWSLRDDPSLRQEMIAAMRDRNVSISLCEGFGVRPGVDIAEFISDLEIAAQLGATRINVVSVDRDTQRSFDQFAKLTELAATFGIETTTEVGAGPVRTLAAGLAAIRHVGRRDFRLLIDFMHFARAGGTPAELAAVDPDVLGYVQLCDVPLVSKHSSYMDEALHERLIPGTGELPLLDLLKALPRHLVLGIEVPQRSLALAGEGPVERVSRSVQATRALLDRLDAR